jgi:hypothetical protein
VTPPSVQGGRVDPAGKAPYSLAGTVLPVIPTTDGEEG